MLTLSKYVLIVLLVLGVASLVQGQDYQRYRLPAGTRITTNGETYQAFNLGEYRDLLLMDADLQRLELTEMATQQQLSSLRTAAAEYQQALAAVDSQVVTLQAERTRLTNLWQEENRLRHLAENGTSWSWIPWTLVVVTSTVAAVFFIAYELK